MKNFKNVKATVIYSMHHGQGVMKNYFKLEDGNILAWVTKTPGYFVEGEEVTLSARFKKLDWVTGMTFVTHVKIKD